MGGRQVAADLHGHQRSERRRGQQTRPVGQVVLDVDQHPARVGSGGKGLHGQVVHSPLDGQRRSGRVHAGCVGQAVATLPWQHGQGGTHRFDPLDGRIQGHQIGLREVPVVVRLLLGAEFVGATLVLVPVAGLLLDSVTGGDEVNLTSGLVDDCSSQRAQRVDVLHLAAGSQLGIAHGPDRHVAVHPHRSLLHLSVRRADGHQNRPKLADVGTGVLSRTQVGSAHDLNEWNASPVVVDQRVAGLVDPTATTHVRALASVLLEVCSLDAHLSAIG